MIIIIAAFVAAFVFLTSPKSTSAAATLGILPTDSGPVGGEIVFNGSNFCIHNPGMSVVITWDGSVVGTGIAPVFQVYYTVPQSESLGQHSIQALATCPGQPPAIPSSQDLAVGTFTVIAPPSNPPASIPSLDRSGTSGSTIISEDKDSDVEEDLEDETYEEEEKEEAKEESEEKDTPWYINWVYLVLIGTWVLIVIGGIVWIIKRKKGSKIKKGEKTGEDKERIEGSGEVPRESEEQNTENTND